jgi:Fe-S oxidoreductase
VCCGNPLESIGRENSTITLIKKALKDTTIKKIVFSCPNCMQSFKPLSTHYELIHVTQILSQYLLTMEPFSKNIIYHDSSILGRYHGIYDEPRALLRKIGPFFEFNETKETAKCCGGDMGFEKAFPELAAQMAEKIWDEARKKNALIVTASPHCYTHLKTHGDVMDITELIDKLMKL